MLTRLAEAAMVTAGLNKSVGVLQTPRPRKVGYLSWVTEVRVHAYIAMLIVLSAFLFGCSTQEELYLKCWDGPADVLIVDKEGKVLPRCAGYLV